MAINSRGSSKIADILLLTDPVGKIGVPLYRHVQMSIVFRFANGEFGVCPSDDEASKAKCTKDSENITAAKTNEAYWFRPFCLSCTAEHKNQVNSIQGKREAKRG